MASILNPTEEQKADYKLLAEICNADKDLKWFDWSMHGIPDLENPIYDHINTMKFHAQKNGQPNPVPNWVKSLEISDEALIRLHKIIHQVKSYE